MHDSIGVTNRDGQLERPSQRSGGGTLQSRNYSQVCIEQLVGLMADVTKADVSPKTVDAACKCATAIVRLIDVNVKYAKSRAKATED